jgi:hypothetical protein
MGVQFICSRYAPDCLSPNTHLFSEPCFNLPQYLSTIHFHGFKGCVCRAYLTHRLYIQWSSLLRVNFDTTTVR